MPTPDSAPDEFTAEQRVLHSIAYALTSCSSRDVAMAQARKVLVALRAVPVEQRMEAMGMRSVEMAGYTLWTDEEEL